MHNRSKPSFLRGLTRSAITSAVLATILAATGCAGRTRSGELPAELMGSGWQHASALAPTGDFDDYISQIEQELRTHRVAFEPAHAERELALVAPFRERADPSCGEQGTRGIAVLVHGLSDSAFAMRDLAGSFARQCFEVRALLLPGHGTRAADLLNVDHEDWLQHVHAAVEQASREHETVVLAGFSLGAVLALTVAAKAPERVDGVIGLSPAYRIRSGMLARQARWVASLRPWLDVDPREEFARYEAMPTRGIATTMAAVDTMHRQVQARGRIPIPWLVVQSADDEVVDTAANLAFFEARSGDPRSAILNYYSNPTHARTSSRAQWIDAAHAELRVAGLSHLAVHIAPGNRHYGVDGEFRNCGSRPFRSVTEIHACRKAASVWYGTGSHRPPPGEYGARATFNPHYQVLEQRIGEFLASFTPTACIAPCTVH